LAAKISGVVIPQTHKEDIYMDIRCFSVIVPQDTDPFNVGCQQMVRLPGNGIAGAKIVADVDGPAEIVAENSLLIVEHGHTLLGEENVEFLIRPTGQGKVNVTLTSTFLNNEPTVTTYEFHVR
jgi:hypothetical protein